MDFINKVKFLKRELFNIFQINLTMIISGLNILILIQEKQV